MGNNIKKIVSFGDSYTFGHDLPDASTAKFSQLTYVALYANHLAVDYQCLAVGGSGTEGTCRRVFETINELNESTLVVIMWPDSYRREIHTEKGWTQIGLPNEFSSEFEKIYYREMLFDNKWMNYLGLKDMLVAQELLKNKNIPYVFLAVKDDLEQLIHTDHPLSRLIDKTRWLTVYKDRGFDMWAKDVLRDTNPGHPGVEPHRLLFENLKGKYEN